MKYFKFSNYQSFSELYKEFAESEQQIDYVTKGNNELKIKMLAQLKREAEQLANNFTS
jgi:hypothetical protein